MTKHSATPALTSVCAAVLLAVSGAAAADYSDVRDIPASTWRASEVHKVTEAEMGGNYTVAWTGGSRTDNGIVWGVAMQPMNISGASQADFKNVSIKLDGYSWETIRGLNASSSTVNVQNFSFDANLTGATVSSETVNPTAILASGSTVTVTGDTNIKSYVTPLDGQSAPIVSNNAVYAHRDGTINLTGENIVIDVNSQNLEKLYEGSYSPGTVKNDAVSAKYTGVVNVNPEGKAKTVKIYGNLDPKNGGTVNLTLANSDSLWHGSQADYSDAGTLNVTLSNGAQWVPDGLQQNTVNSVKDEIGVERITQLTLQEGGIVNTHGLNQYTGQQTAVKELHIDQLNGSGGIFIMDLSAAGEDNDFLYVTSGSGAHEVMPVDTSKLAGVSRENPIWFADTASGVTFEGYGEKSTLEDGFVYDYTPVVDKDVKDTDANTNGTNWYIVGVETETTPTADTVISDASLNYAAATTFLELDSLNKRLGEIRSYGAGHTGVWVRAKAGRMSSNKSGSFRDTYQFYQLGADYAYRPADAKGTFLFGGAIHTSKNDATLASGTGDLDTVGGSLYASWSDDSGWYADLIGKYSHLDDDYTITSNGQSAKASYSNDAWSLSIEGGKRFENKGWVFEPQAQLVYTYIDGANYRLSNGVRVDQDSTDSIIGRAGFRLGHDFKFAEKLQNSKAYVKADLYHEFMGDRSVVVTGNDASLRRDVDGSDTWLSFGLGADFTITERLFAYADFEKSVAGDVKTKWQVNAGVRYAF